MLRHPLPRLGQLGPDYSSTWRSTAGRFAEAALAMLGILAFLYFFLFTALRGQTFGKHLMRVRVIDAYGERPSMMAGAGAHARLLPSLVLLALGFLWIGFDREKRGLHDWLADTYVVKAMTSRLASLLVQDGLVSAKKMAEAFQRQVIYGGTLDTILLEMDVIDEGTLLDALGRSSALPIAGDLPSLEQLQAADVQKWMPPAMSERFAPCRGARRHVLRVLVIDPPDRKQLDELGYTLSLTIEPIIVPEHRFVQAVELVYGVPVPARFASLAAKLRQRATDPESRSRLTPSQPALPIAAGARASVAARAECADAGRRSHRRRHADRAAADAAGDARTQHGARAVVEYRAHGGDRRADGRSRERTAPGRRRRPMRR